MSIDEGRLAPSGQGSTDDISRHDMQGGFRGLSERILGVPKRVVLGERPVPEYVPPDFARVAQCLHDVEHGLDGLWPED